MKRVILFLVLLVLCVSFVSADTTLNQDFENNSVQGWTAGLIESTNPLSGSYSINLSRPGANDYEARALGMNGNSSFNVTFKFRQNAATNWVAFGLADRLTAGGWAANRIHICMGGANQCETGGDSSWLWVSGSDSGLRCSAATSGAGCNLTIEVNASNSGNTSISTVFRLHLNSQNTSWLTPYGTLPSRKVKAIWAGTQSIDDKIWYDDIVVLNSTTSVAGVPSIYAINCTSCNSPYNVSPYTTADTTPTFRFLTEGGANCRIGDENQNYSAMTSGAGSCDGDGLTAHNCTLTVQDELVSSTDYVYLSCQSAGGAELANASRALEMSITSLSGTVLDAFDRGIQSSVIWPGAVVYTNQQVYLRSLSNQQVLATVDKVAVYGNQRWILNNGLDGENTLGLFNITPVVYVLDVVNVSSTSITSQVSALINATKN